MSTDIKAAHRTKGHILTETSEFRETARRKLAAWSARLALAGEQNQPDVEVAAQAIIKAYESLIEKNADAEPEYLQQANALRKRLESAENHRTMAAEHGLNDEAIDVTYEIQKIEKALVGLINGLKM
jgi:hypothetical protein